ncbi:MAG: hypothetical protein UY59_C0038G0013 [Candidatus Kaiserbacteria bacterium GW2011_GWA1_50_28]|uniref:Uncharacterized protein n=1 Tax=Candidatus Kaiserbacteria bacterium GW2011_GWA1_50_28 TaxID=1618668 RepID=A0A0G1WF02_9BACT|nr:MAG: hypothetical protein UY59_C0038G0013 [Candidatus Kaiserbacteria bacterium GW2011_GWA1_50_28]
MITSGLLRRPIAIALPLIFTASTISLKRLRASVVEIVLMPEVYKMYISCQVACAGNSKMNRCR